MSRVDARNFPLELEMIESDHVSKDDLLELLNSDQDTPRTRSIGEHLHHCEKCRKVMESMAARSEIWDKAPAMLGGSPSLGSGPISGPEGEATTDLRPAESDSFSKPQAEANEGWNYPIDGLLDPPNHPEMLGRIGKYDLEREVGRGGMGIVFRAHDSELNRPLAIKILAPHLASHGTARKRFAQEARAAAGVHHPNVIAVYDVSNEGKTPYIVMPFVPGPSLQKLVEENGPLTEMEIAQVALQIAAGLTPAHARGIVHRDIKPANILLAQGVHRVIITDFGLARAEDDASLTRTGWLTGTPNYMSPEQTRGERLDQRSDLFSLGSLLYFLATGRLPFRADSPLGVLTRIQNDEPTPIRAVNNQISATLADVISVLLCKDPARRFQSAAELHELLQKHVAYLHQPDISKPPAVPFAKTKTASNSRWLVGGLAVAVVSAIFASFQLMGFFERKPVTEWNLPTNRTQDSASSYGETNSLDRVISNKDVIVLSNDPERNSFPNESPIVFTDAKEFQDIIVQDVGSDDSDWNWLSNRGSGYSISVGGMDREKRKAQEALNQGLEELLAKNYEKAKQLFERAAEDEDLRDVATYNIGCVFALTGKKDAAFAKLREAAELGFYDTEHFKDDDDLKALRSDKRFESLLVYVSSIEKAAELVEEGKSLADQEEFEEAEKVLRKALKLDPPNAGGIVNLGYAIHMQGRIDEAMEWHRKASQTKGEKALGFYNMACVFALKNDKDMAIKHLDKAVEAGLGSRVGMNLVRNDADLKIIRKTKIFAELLDEMEATTSRFQGYRTFVQNNEEEELETYSLGIADQSVKGKWKGWLTKGQMHLTVARTNKQDKAMWAYSFNKKAAEFNPSLTTDTKEFRLQQKQGTLIFEGAFSGRKGEGSFRFEGSETYRKQLAEDNIPDASDPLLFRLFISWEDEKDVLENLKELQTLDVDKTTKQALMIHGVEADLVLRYQARELDVKKHLLFVVWRVKPRDIIAYNDAGLDLKEHRPFIHKRIPASLVVEYRQAGFSLEEQEEFLTSRVPAKLLKRYVDKGFKLGDNIDFIRKRVEPELLEKYEVAGLEVKKYKKFIDWRVEPRLLQSYDESGLNVETYERQIQQRIPASLVRSYLDSDLDPKETRYFMQNRVPAKLIKQYVDEGLDPDDYRKALRNRLSPSEAKRNADDEDDDCCDLEDCEEDCKELARKAR